MGLYGKQYPWLTGGYPAAGNPKLLVVLYCMAFISSHFHQGGEAMLSKSVLYWLGSIESSHEFDMK